MVNSCELTGFYTNWPNGPFYALSLPVKLMNERETFHLSLGGLKDGCLCYLKAFPAAAARRLLCIGKKHPGGIDPICHQDGRQEIPEAAAPDNAEEKPFIFWQKLLKLFDLYHEGLGFSRFPDWKRDAWKMNKRPCCFFTRPFFLLFGFCSLSRKA